MASSTSSCCGGNSRWSLARQWWAHTAGILLFWTRLGLPLALGAVWLSGLEWTPLNGLPFLVGPLAACLYAALWIALRGTVRIKLVWLKAADTALLALAPALAAALLGLLWHRSLHLWLWVPAAGLFPVTWWINWMHSAPPTAPGKRQLPPAPSFLPPVQGPVTAGYRSYDRSHTGVDIGVPIGTPVVAPAGGRVLHAGPLEHWGHVLWIDHGGGWSTFLAHLDSVCVSKGTPVEAGQIAGCSGTTGISTGPHVHVELRYHGAPVDPQSLVRT